ncbi:hypothetical protein M5D96_001487 [Drosophila gunungcola]|uniref:Uncharacterized protein n=1 Tax=Drosophila gunungcola TaxID=103775 RepID=A0A9Q0BUR3_9MUSC|nr:hypothetical protein M5D96_001487 [Drosophila gunungcola]
MNYLIQRGKLRQQAINVPEGLPELLSDITREVLRCQPKKECLCQFIIDYLHSVIVTREKALVAKSILDRALREVDSIISDLCVCDLSKEKSELMGQVLEDCFRNFLEKRRCEMRRGKQTINFEDKCKFSDQELILSRPAIESAYKRFVDAYMSAQRGADGTELLYQYFRDRELKRINEAMREQAAITIQSAWRGYWVRLQFPQEVALPPSPSQIPVGNLQSQRKLRLALRRRQGRVKRLSRRQQVQLQQELQELRRELRRELLRELLQELHRELHQELLQELRRELRQQLHRELHQELRQQLLQELLQELHRELRQQLHRELLRQRPDPRKLVWQSRKPKLRKLNHRLQKQRWKRHQLQSPMRLHHLPWKRLPRHHPPKRLHRRRRPHHPLKKHQPKQQSSRRNNTIFISFPLSC